MRKSIAAALIAASSATAACSHERDEDGGPAVSRRSRSGISPRSRRRGRSTSRSAPAPTRGAGAGNQKLVEKLVVEVKGDKLVIRPEERHGWFHWGRPTARRRSR